MELQTTKVKIRDWQTEDLPRYAHFNTQHHKWMELDAPYYTRSTTKEIENYLKKIGKNVKNKDWQTPRTRLVIADINTNELIGTVSWYWQSKPTNWVSIGIALYNENTWGKGLGYDALQLWCKYLFEMMPKIARLDLRTWSGNLGMMCLAEKLGFQLEARFRKARFYNNKYYDSIGYGILREEWEVLYLKE